MLARLRAMGEDEFAALPFGSEGLWQKVMHACRTEASLEGILAAAKSKRYPRTRLMRMLLCGFLGLTEQQLAEPAPYVRVLALDADLGLLAAAFFHDSHLVLSDTPLGYLNYIPLQGILSR